VLSSFDKMFVQGQEYFQKNTLSTAQVCSKGLINKVLGLQSDGTTALGPAVAFALGLVSNCPGSKILVCTDGQANVGYGNISSGSENVKGNYQIMGSKGKENGTNINVLSIKGEDCALENLGILSDMTYGVVDIVEPQQLKSTVSNVMSKPVLGTGLTCKLICDHRLIFTRSGNNIDTQEIGNVNSDVDLTFSFAPKELFENEDVYFQAQLSFSKLNGSQIKRSITYKMKITNDRDVSEKNLRTFVLAMKAVHESAEMAQFGEYQNARVNLISYQRLLQRGMKSKKDQREYINFIVQAEKLDAFMRTFQAQEKLLDTNPDLQIDDFAAKYIIQMKRSSHVLFESYN